MVRRKGSGKFDLPDPGAEEEINPMDGLPNLADVMLVFACGLMLALITFWNVDVAGTVSGGPSENDPERQELTETAAALDSEEGEEIDSDDLEQYGLVFRDPETGKLYIIAESGD